MRRRTFAFFAAVSLLLFVATVVLWVRSYWRVNALFYHLHGATVAAVVRPGTIEFAGYHERAYYWPTRWQLFDEEDDLPQSGRGDEWTSYLLFGQPQLRMSFWAIAIAAIILPLLWLYRRVKKSAGIHNCNTCGYDLTGNISGVCPECGTAAKAERTVC